MPDKKLIDVLMGSKELKRLLVERSNKFSIPFRDLCQEVGVDYSSFMRSYVNSSVGDPEVITEDQFIELMGKLGITVRYQFLVEREFDKKIEMKKLLNSGN